MPLLFFVVVKRYGNRGVLQVLVLLVVVIIVLVLVLVVIINVLVVVVIEGPPGFYHFFYFFVSLCVLHLFLFYRSRHGLMITKLY